MPKNKAISSAVSEPLAFSATPATIKNFSWSISAHGPRNTAPGDIDSPRRLSSEEKEFDLAMERFNSKLPLRHCTY